MFRLNIISTLRSVFAPLNHTHDDKVDKVTGKSLSTNDYTTAEKNKLAGVTESADAVSYSQTVASSTSGAYEVGKITINGTATTIYGKDTNNTYTAESTATNIKMNGTQSAGSLATYARGDHVHPSDTSKISTSAIKNDLTTGGATNVLSAEQGKNLQNNKLNNTQTNIAANTDLNTIKSAGWYYNGSNANVKTMSNTPWQTAPPSSGEGTGWAFSMFVMKAYGTVQLLFPYNSTSYSDPSKYKCYIRINYNNDADNSWTQWWTLMDTELITKLNGITEGADAVSYSQTSGSSVSGVYEVGKITINGTATTIYGKDTNTTYSAVGTTGNPGLMTAADKVKLNNITESADAVSYSQTSGSSVSGAYEIGKITINGTATTIYGKDTNTTYSAVGTSGDPGLMTAADKVKLNNVATGATNTSFSYTNGVLTINNE